MSQWRSLLPDLKLSADAVTESSSIDEEKLRHFEIIQRFASQLTVLEDVDELLWFVAEDVIPHLDFEDCVIYLLDIEANRLQQKAAWGAKMPGEREILNPIQLKVGEGVVGSVAANGEPITINDTRLDKRYKIDDIERLSECSVPLLYDGRVIGVLDSEHSNEDYFTDYRQQLLITVAAMIATRVGKSISMQKVERTIEKLRNAEKLQKALYEIASLLHKAQNMKDFYRRLHKIIGELMYANNFYIALFDRKLQLINIPYFVDTVDVPPDESIPARITQKEPDILLYATK